MVAEKYSFTVTKEFSGKRLDQYLTEQTDGNISRSQIQRSIKQAQVKINNSIQKSAHYRVVENDNVHLLYEQPVAKGLQAEAIELNIVYEDDVLIVLNKPVGMVVHPGAGVKNKTLANALLHHCREIKNVGEDFRPGIVHRIDKNTSGLLVIAKNVKVHETLSQQFKEHTIKRKYQTIVKGVVQYDEGTCDVPIGKGVVFRRKILVGVQGAKRAVTHFRVLKRFDKATFLEVELETGRTHQIRVHFAYMGHPLLGDLTYGVKSPYIQRQALHAKTLGFVHPITSEYMEFDSCLPEDMQFLLSKLD